MPTPTDSSRRQFLTRAMALAVAAPFSSLLPSISPASSAEAATDAAQDVLDEALERLARTGPEYGGGLANHGPMASEALVILGRPDAVRPWVERYRKRLEPHPPPGRVAIQAGAWKEALGSVERVGDWIRWFDRQLAESPWTEVLDTWTPRLAPGLAAAGMHGLIRTGHAARSLSNRDTPARRHELAEGLAYWAARYQTLPDTAAPSPQKVGTKRPSQAIEGVPLLPNDGRPSNGSIAQAFRRLDGFTAFEGVAGMVDASGDAGAFISDLTGTFARVYLRQTAPPRPLIGFLHGVTAPGAMRLLTPHLGETARVSLLRHGWQAAAGLYAAMASGPAAAGSDGNGGRQQAETSTGNDDLVDRAVATGDEHAMKITECCLRENAIRPDPAYLMVARDAVSRLG